MSKAKQKGTRRKKKRKIQIRFAGILFDIFLGFLVITVIPVLIYGLVNPSTTSLMWIRWIDSDYQDKYPRFFSYWQPIEEISPHLIKAVVAAEDQKFFRHSGFDWEAVKYALKTNLTTDRTLGASTISMQTSRNVFLWQSRSLLRKSLESYFTFLIENFWSKKRILEVYLNIIEWGDGIYGCETAARAYFNHSSKTLSPVEAAWMAAVLPNPRVWSIRNPQDHVKAKQARILNSMSLIRLPRLK